MAPAMAQDKSPAMSSAFATAAVPPLRLRPSPPSAPHDDDDRERRNATALTIVELLAGQRNSSSSSSSISSSSVIASPMQQLPRVVLPSLPKMKLSPPQERPWLLAAPPAALFGLVGAADKLAPLATAALAPVQVQQQQVAAAVQNAAPPTVNNSRKRQKDELTRLRAQVQELQRELEHVRGRLPHKQPTAVRAAGAGEGGAGGSGAGAASAVGTPVWERMAQHQKEEKSKAEMENLRLKGLIQEQVKISRGLEKLLKKRCKNMTENPFPEKRRRLCDVSESSLFEALVASVDARLPELETVFEKSGMAKDKREIQETQMILDERRGPVMEVKDAKILPFDVATCSNALWACIEQEAINHQEKFDDLDVCPIPSPIKKERELPQAPADTIYMKGVIPLRQHRAPDAELEIRGVMKRFVDPEQKRVLFLWESVVECPSKLLNYAVKDAEVRDFGWGVLEPLTGSLPGDSSTLVQLCSYISPSVGGGSLSEECRQHVHSLADLVVPSFRQMWGKRQRVLENLLMDSAVGGSNSSKSPIKTEKPRP